MDDTLKRLLDAEQRGQALVVKALADRDQLIDKALEEVKSADARFRARIPEIRDDFIIKADERAAQAIAEKRRRYQERLETLEQEAEHHHDQAVAAALDVLLKA